MTNADTEYYRERAATERALAKASDNQKVAAIHEELARRYEALVARAQLHLVAA